MRSKAREELSERREKNIPGEAQELESLDFSGDYFICSYLSQQKLKIGIKRQPPVFWIESGGQLIILYGRRRVGKKETLRLCPV